MKVAAIQMTSGPDVAANLEQARALLEDAAGRGARLAALPENFSFMGLKDADKRAVAEVDGSGAAQDFLAASARRLHLWIVGGTIPLRSGADGRVAAASLVYNTDGRRVARYDKDRKSTRLNSSHSQISYAVFCLKKKNKKISVAVSMKQPFDGLALIDLRLWMFVLSRVVAASHVEGTISTIDLNYGLTALLSILV